MSVNIELTDQILQSANTAVMAAEEAVAVANIMAERVQTLDGNEALKTRITLQAKRNQLVAEASLAVAILTFDMLCDAHDAAIAAEVAA